MNTSVGSNEQRSKQRARCREMLSQYLHAKLGIDVPPAEVRMHPREVDSYRWSILPEKKYLFEKNLSKLSTGMYRQIMQGIGIFIEALPRDLDEREMAVDPSSTDPEASSSPDVASTSFTANISILQNEVALLREESRRWQASATLECEKRTKLEEEMGKAKVAFLKLRKEHVMLREDLRKTRRQYIDLGFKAQASYKGVQQIRAISHRLAAIQEGSVITDTDNSP